MSKKKLLSLGMVTALVLSNLPATVIQAQEVSPGSGTVEEIQAMEAAQEAQVLETDQSSEDEFVIDEEGTLTKYNGKGGKVVIPDGVTAIGEYAFSSCTSLTSVTIPDGVTFIRESAFSGCSNLTSVSIPNSVISIEQGAFWGCGRLTDIVLPAHLTTINDSVFYECSSLTSVTIPNGVKSIQRCAFDLCSNLKSVKIPDSVTSIGSEAFIACSSLKDITIPDSVTSIGSDAFSLCTSLESIVIPEGVKTISRGVFGNCKNLKSVKIPDSVTSIEGAAFYRCSSLTDIVLPDHMAAIGKSSYAGVFEGCSSLRSIIIPNGVKVIEGSTFAGCESLESVTIPDSVTHISYNAFKGCSSLKSVTIPKSVTSIQGNSFDKNIIIYGYKNSKAEEWAKAHGVIFRLADRITCEKKTYDVTYGVKPFTIEAFSTNKLTYTSSDKKVVTVDKNGKATVKGCGVAVITVKESRDSVKVTVKVNPKKQAVKSIKTAKGKKLTVKWAKDKGVTGYQVQLSTAKNFKKIAKQKKLSKNTYTFTKLKAKSKYYVRVRSYKKSGKNMLYGAWSSVKKSGSIQK